ncbi:MAG: DUF4407 domain-containing protein, partial [Thermoanaerobaculia bacterium]
RKTLSRDHLDFCHGLLDRVPRSETIKQIGYGTLVVVPAVLAFFAMSYALSTLTESRLVYMGGGVVWSVIVFCFDRFIVSTFRKSQSTIDDLTSMVFLSRLAFAAFVGVLVAHPLVMLYFNDSVEERLVSDGRLKVAAMEADSIAKQQEIRDRIGVLKTEIRERERERNDYQATLVAEIDGIVSGRTTGIPGRGASAEEKKLQLQTAQLELDTARDRNLVEIGALQAGITTLQNEAAAEKASFTQSTDYLARAGALEALSAEHQHVRNVKWFIIVFFVFVDTLPILFKGFTPRGPYDDQLALAEFKSERSTQAERDSLDRVLYPHMVISRENRFLSDQNHRGVEDYASRYRSFLDQLARHQDEFLTEWQRQQEILSHLEDEELRDTQLSYMEKLRTSSADVVNKAVDQFQRSLAWDSAKNDGGAEPA